MTKISIVFPCALALLFCSCASLYMPNVPNTPMLSSKGELHASGHMSLRGNVSLNTAYAASDHMGVLVNGSFISRDRSKSDFKQALVEAGAGYFDTFGENGNRIFEVYGGFGKGKSEEITNDLSTAGELTYDRTEMHFQKAFIQFNYSSKRQNALVIYGKEFPINYGTAIRTSYLSTSKLRFNNVDLPAEDNIFIEPVFFTRIHLSDAVQLQYTSGTNFGLKNRKYLTAGNSVFSLGISINAGSIFK